MALTSPQGREVLLLHGDADAMAAQGTTLIHFGELMNESGAYTTAMASDSAIGMGFSIESLRELARFCAGDLQLVGRRYRAQGQAVNIYAEAFDDAKISIAKLVPEIETLEARRQLLTEHIAELEPFVPFLSNTACAHPELFDMPTQPQTLDEDEVKAFDDAVAAERTTRTTELAEVESNLETDMASYDRAFDTWEEATTAALTALEKANTIAADSTAENVYQYYAFAEEAISVIGDMVDQISAIAAITGIGLPLAAALQSGATVIRAAGVALSLGKAIFPDSDVHRSAGQRQDETRAITTSLYSLIPFSGAVKAIGESTNEASQGGNDVVEIWRGAQVDSWRRDTQEHPYEPPRRRADGTPRTTTYKVPR